MNATPESATKEAAPVTLPALAAQPNPLANLMRDCGTPDAPETEQDAPPVCRSLADLAPPLPEKDDPAALFHNGWLRKGGGAFLVSTSGTGKSVWTVQASLLWAQGLPAFGIEPVRPLKIGIVQAEDDDEEMVKFRNNITDGLVEQAGLDLGQVEAAARSGVYLFNPVGKVGVAFIEYLGKILEIYPELDLLIVNPLQSYFGGDISRNADVSGFLRGGLDPLIKPDKVGVLFVHHTNKPPNAKERTGWGTDAFAAYIGAGGAEIVNWARAMLALMPCENDSRLFRLTAAKRGQRLGWKDAGGEPTNVRFIAHSENRIFWRDATPEEERAAQASTGGKKTPSDPKADAEQLANRLREQASPLSDARALAGQLFPRARGRVAFDLLKATPAAFQLSLVQAKHKGCMFIGAKGQAEAAADEYDAKMSPQNGGKG
jgi:hypothetical protein